MTANARWVAMSLVVVAAVGADWPAARATAAAYAGTPYSGVAVSLPGTIEAENFDNGGEGVAYHDSTPGNAGGAYRATDVDVEASTEGNYDVGWIAAGEWLNYTVTVASAGTYAVQLRVASMSAGGTVHVGFNGASSVWVPVAIPATGGWQNWTTVSFSAQLSAGTQQVTLYFDTAGMNVNYVKVLLSSGSSTPYTGTAAPIPGTIQAEDFDNGGEGVAYHDSTPGNTGGGYRSTDVDIEASTEGNYDVGWIAAGEWLNYSVAVASSGSYNVLLRVAAPAGGTLHVGFTGGSGTSTSVVVPATGGWQNWTTVSFTATLTAGSQLLTLYFDTAGFNVNYVTVNAATDTAPSVSLTAPASGTTFTAPATITLTAAASTQSGSISKVDFYAGSTLIGTDTSSPYSFSWSSVAAGTYSLTARATSTAGPTATSAAVSVTVNAAAVPPSVSLTAPASGSTFTAPAAITLTATASTQGGSISKVDFYAGSALIGTDTSSPYSFSWSNVAAGTYSLTARATSTAGPTATSAAVSVTVTAATAGATATFTPSTDDMTDVTSYKLDLFTSGANPSTAASVASQNLGKPAIVSGQMSVNIASLIASLQTGSYFATVTAIGPGGSTRSTSSNTFSR